MTAVNMDKSVEPGESVEAFDLALNATSLQGVATLKRTSVDGGEFEAAFAATLHRLDGVDLSATALPPPAVVGLATNPPPSIDKSKVENPTAALLFESGTASTVTKRESDQVGRDRPKRKKSEGGLIQECSGVSGVFGENSAAAFEDFGIAGDDEDVRTSPTSLVEALMNTRSELRKM